VGNRRKRKEEKRTERENDQQQHAKNNKNSKKQDNKLKKKRAVMLSRAVHLRKQKQREVKVQGQRTVKVRRRLLYSIRTQESRVDLLSKIWVSPLRETTRGKSFLVQKIAKLHTFMTGPRQRTGQPAARRSRSRRNPCCRPRRHSRGLLARWKGC
jgi:hypothetical protein